MPLQKKNRRYENSVLYGKHSYRLHAIFDVKYIVYFSGN